MSASSILSFIFTASGIYAAYLTQGDVSEKLSTEEFNGTRFHHMHILPMFQSIACFMVALIALGVSHLSSRNRQYPRIQEYCMVSLTSSVGPSMGYASLRNISYPAQVVVKSCKMIPVMLMGSLLYGVRYSAAQWAMTATICGGLVLFSSAASHVATSKLADAHMLLGYALCFGNLCFDGFTNSRQDVINKKYKNSSSIHMMCFMNYWQAIYYAVWFCLLEVSGYSKAVLETYGLVLESSTFCWHLLKFCLCGALGQLFIFKMIHSQGSLINVLVTTTRKFFSILVSVFINGTPLVGQQWVGVFMVFFGVLWNIYAKHGKKPKDQSDKPKVN